MANYTSINYDLAYFTCSYEKEVKSASENFIDYFDICGPDEVKIDKILSKKHSKRTEKEKEIIRDFIREDKPDKPKINLPGSNVEVPFTFTYDMETFGGSILITTHPSI